MEKLILASLAISKAYVRRLAEQRDTVASNWLTQSGGVAAARVFITQPKLNADDIKDKGKPNRVEFALK